MEWAVFVVAALITLAGAVGVVTSTNTVHAALFLIQTLFGVAVLFVQQNAHFLAAVQVIVYAGAIVVLFLFVIMLLGVDRSEDVDRDPLRGQRPAAVIIGLLIALEIFFLGRVDDWATGRRAVTGQLAGGHENTRQLAEVMFSRYLLAFEITSVLLVIAIVGAVVLARRTPRAAGDLERT